MCSCSGSYNIQVRRGEDDWCYVGVTSKEFKTRFYKHNSDIALGTEEIAKRRKVNANTTRRRPLYIHEVCAAEGANHKKRILSTLPLHNSGCEYRWHSLAAIMETIDIVLMNSMNKSNDVNSPWMVMYFPHFSFFMISDQKICQITVEAYVQS